MAEEHRDNPFLPDERDDDPQRERAPAPECSNILAPAMPTPPKQRRALARLIWQWTHNGVEHRLVAKADHTPHYEDEYIVEKLGLDVLDEPCWTRVVSHRPRKGDVYMVDFLISALKSTITEAP